MRSATFHGESRCITALTARRHFPCDPYCGESAFIISHSPFPAPRFRAPSPKWVEPPTGPTPDEAKPAKASPKRPPRQPCEGGLSIDFKSEILTCAPGVEEGFLSSFVSEFHSESEHNLLIDNFFLQCGHTIFHFFLPFFCASF